MRFKHLFTKQTLAQSPRDFSFTDWKAALLATKDSVGDTRIGILAAGIAYFMTFAFFPLIAASIAIASFMLEPQQIQDAVQLTEQFFPADIATLINDQLTAALANKSASTIVAVISILIALFSISGAVQNSINASNAVYGVDESRAFIRLRLVSLAVLGIFFVAGLAIIGVLLLNVSFLQSLGVPYFIAVVLSFGRWLVLPFVLGLALSAFYRYGPNRSNPKWQWVTWGSAIAAVLWLLVTALFFIYVRFFANFTESYGTLAGIIVLMSWLNLSAFCILLGAAVNNQLEQRTGRKTTK